MRNGIANRKTNLTTIKSGILLDDTIQESKALACTRARARAHTGKFSFSMNALDLIFEIIFKCERNMYGHGQCRICSKVHGLRYWWFYYCTYIIVYIYMFDGWVYDVLVCDSDVCACLPHACSVHGVLFVLNVHGISDEFLQKWSWLHGTHQAVSQPASVWFLLFYFFFGSGGSCEMIRDHAYCAKALEQQFIYLYCFFVCGWIYPLATYIYLVFLKINLCNKRDMVVWFFRITTHWTTLGFCRVWTRLK